MKNATKENGLKITLFGTFCVTAPDGTDLTPRSVKSQGLLALLATSRNHNKRTRPWLQDKLWSQKDQSKSATSLRQELQTIRRSLKDHAPLLQADRHVVWLASEAFQSDFDDLTDPDWSTFLEGMDIGDDEFENWLTTMRNQGATPQAAAPVARSHPEPCARWKAVLVRSQTSTPEAQYLEAEFIGLLSRSLTEFGIAEISETNSENSDPNAFQVSVSATPIGAKQFGFRVSVLSAASKRILWSDTRTVPSGAGQVESNLPLITLTHMVQSAITREISFSARNSQGIDPRALVLGRSTPRIFSFDAEQLTRIDRRLQQITDGPERAVALGWRTQISVIRDIEQLTNTPDETVEHGLSLATRALEANPMNSLVLSATANAQVFLNWDIDTGAELSRLAIRVNPSNPLAWWSYANVALYSDDTETALKSARIASQLAENSQLRFWCKFQLGLAALQHGDVELAKRSLEASAAIAPRFRPPRRYLLTIYAHQREMKRAAKMARNLEEIEKDFSLDRLISDDTYPISLARKMNLIDAAVLADLSP